MFVGVITVALSAVWLLSGSGKLATPGPNASFVGSLINRPLPTNVVRFFAVAEIGISIGLATPATRPWSALASAMACGMIIVALLRAYQLGQGRLRCGCFGTLMRGRGVGTSHFVLAGAMVTASLVVLYGSSHSYLGHYAQVIATAVAMVLVGARYVRLRRAFIEGYQSELEV